MNVATEIRPTKGIWSTDDDSVALLNAETLDRPPIKLILSLCGHCNIRCFHCLGTSEEMVATTQDPGSASPELVDFIVDQVVPGVRAIRIGGVSYTEELTSRTFDYFMERMMPHAPQLGAFELITNLSLMNERRADLLAGCLTEIQVSLEGVEDNFTRLRGFRWSVFVRNLGLIVAAKKRNPASRMKITFVLCAMSDMLDDLLRLDLFKSLGAERIILRELQPRAEKHLPHVLYNNPEQARAFVREFSRRAQIEGIETALNIAGKYDPPEPQAVTADSQPQTQAAGPTPMQTCARPFETLTVLHNGGFGVCDFITDLGVPFETFSQANIMDVWNNPQFKALRRAVNSSSPPPVCLSCEIKTGHLTEQEKAHYRADARSDRGTPIKFDEWTTSMGHRYVDHHWFNHTNSERRETALLTRAEKAEQHADYLLSTIAERDRTIDAMRQTRAWRLATRWVALKRTVRKLGGG